MKKSFAALTALAGIAMSPVAHAAVIDQINSANLLFAHSDNFGAVFHNEPGSFTNVFNFFVFDDSLANSSFTTSILGGNDIDFTSIFLDSASFTQTGFDPGAEQWELSPVSIGAGWHKITAKGSVVGSSQDGSYAGTLNVVNQPAVPEPSTWAMMLVGFGAVGGAMRRRKAATPKVNFSFA